MARKPDRCGHEGSQITMVFKGFYIPASLDTAKIILMTAKGTAPVISAKMAIMVYIPANKEYRSTKTASGAIAAQCPTDELQNQRRPMQSTKLPQYVQALFRS